VDRFIIRNSNWYRDSALTRATHWMWFETGAAIDQLILNQISANRCTYLVNKDAGTLGSVLACNITHTDSASGFTLRVNGGTVDEFVLSNWIGANQSTTAGGGAITVQRGDAFDSEAASPIQPDAVAGLEQWNKPETLGADTTAISSWTDSSTGGANPLVQATSGSQPVVAASILNGFKVARFDGTDDYLHSSPTSSAARTIIFVAKKRSAPGSSTVDILNLGTTVNSQFYVNSTVDATHPAYYDVTGGGVASGGNVTQWNVYELRFSNEYLLSVVINGTQVLTGDPENSYFGSALMTVAAFNDGTLAADLDVAEVIVYSELISSGDSAGVLLYLQDKYAL